MPSAFRLCSVFARASKRVAPRPIAGAAIVASLLIAGGGIDDPTSAQAGSLVRPSSSGQTVTTAKAAPVPTSPGRVAYVTPSGDVVVAQSDGSAANVIGSGAVANSAGLAPLAWSPAGDVVAYVRKDGALVIASTSGKPEVIAATNAVVPPGVDENVLSIDVTGVAIAYLADAGNGRYQAMVTRFDTTDPKAKDTTPLTDPADRVPTAFEFSPLDVYLYLQSKDVETGRDFTIALVDPFSGTPIPSPFSVDDPSFSPDGALVYGVTHVGDVDQILSVDANTGQTQIIQTQDRICHPQASSDGKRIVYAAGTNCGEVWVVNRDGSDPTLISRSPLIGASFTEGDFSWSLDDTTVSHAACTRTGPATSCSGAYVDIKIASKAVKTRAPAASVRREFRPLIKPLKVDVEVTGAISYHEKMLISLTESKGDPLRQPLNGVDLRAKDERDTKRVFSYKILTADQSQFVTGTLGVSDPANSFDHQFVFIGAILLRSYRYAVMRAIWFDTTSMPFRTGRIDLTIYR